MGNGVALDPSRFEAVERELAEAQATITRLEREAWRIRHMLEVTQETLTVFENGVVIDTSPQFEVMFRGKREDAIGKHAFEFVAPESHALVAEHQRRGSVEPYEATLLRMDGSTFVARIRAQNFERDGRTIRIATFADATAEKLAAEVVRTAAVVEETMQLQTELLVRLSNPLLPIAEGTLLLPLIGVIDEDRASGVLGTLTQGIVAHDARFVILDVTGVEALDTQVANLLVTCARAAALLGARVLLTGIRADVARTLVTLGHDLGSLVTFATLKQGVAHALGARR
ncbi:STAS domain-containing protein [Polyangium jinanense]|uniref:PAS domain-containing protein n=1 Tax=Polyangium jinanense TaxID=2829994 RepID=A0A9X4ASN9_9BACT|nr:STAS domain-containing protein [Polyangium jinanense]MDC3957299.1 PAS domain-containing protein [Polyangium jinanense]MDC3982701.1 PAS domain-containing protein [Polyangium jinanense]